MLTWQVVVRGALTAGQRAGQCTILAGMPHCCYRADASSTQSGGLVALSLLGCTQWQLLERVPPDGLHDANLVDGVSTQHQAASFFHSSYHAV